MAPSPVQEVHAGQPDALDPIDRLGCRPDFQALIYGGAWPDMPTFTDDDPLINSSTLAGLYLALKEENVPAELHIYATGGHGFGIRKPPAPHASAMTWQVRLADWLADRGLSS